MTDTDDDTSKARSERQIFSAVLRANALIGALLLLASFVIFAVVASRLENPIATMVLDEHLGQVVWKNARTLPAYLLLTAAFTLLGYPLARRLPSLRRGRRVRGFVAVCLVNLLLFVLSLGLAARDNPSFLDVAARAVPAVDLYWIYDWSLPTVLLGALGAVALFGVWTYGRLLRGVRGGAVAVLAALAGVGAFALASVVGRGTAEADVGVDVAGKEPPSVLILASDSLRADHLSAYGYRRPTPAIDALAAEGVLLEAMHVPIASTLESWTSLLTSRWPVGHGLRYIYPTRAMVARVNADRHALPRLLARERGYHTFVVSDYVGNCFRLVDLGFQANHASDPQNLGALVAEAVLRTHLVFPLYFNNGLGRLLFPEINQITTTVHPTRLVRETLDEIDAARAKGRPFFGVLFTSGTHLPFKAAYPFNTRWVDRSYRGRHRYHVDLDVDTFIKRGFREALTPAEVQHVVDLYDGAVAEFDHHVGRVVEALRRRGLLERTIIVVTSDHGEDLYDPDTTFGHGTGFFGGDQNTRVPLVLRLPGRRFAGTRVAALTRTVDLAPTLLQLLQLEVPRTYRGRSLLPQLRDPRRDPGLLAFAETAYLFFPKRVPGVKTEELLIARGRGRPFRLDPDFDYNLVLRGSYHAQVIGAKDRMVRSGRWKLIAIAGKRGPIYRLYDMRADPRQRVDLSGRNLAVQARLAARLDAYWRGRVEEASAPWPAALDEPDALRDEPPVAPSPRSSPRTSRSHHRP